MCPVPATLGSMGVEALVPTGRMLPLGGGIVGVPVRLFCFVLFLILFIFGCVGSSLLCVGFLPLRLAGATLRRHGLSLQSTGSRHTGFSSHSSRAPERRLSSRGAQAQSLRGMWDPPGQG